MKNITLKIILTLFLLTFAVFSKAQITQLTIGVDGFTCSLCAKGVEGEFKALDFVKSVKTDLKETQFILTFKPKSKVDISKISDAVSDGGFTVRDINIVAKGALKGDQNTGYTLVTTNTPEIGLNNVSGNFNSGDNIVIVGLVDPVTHSVNVTSIKKL